MQVCCPSCATNFAVPDRALLPSGRTLKCAKCGEKWFQTVSPPEPEPAMDFGLDEDSFPPPPPRFDPPPRMDFSLDDAPARPSFSGGLDMDLPDPPLPDFGRGRGDDARPGDLDLGDGEPAPIPSLFTAQPKKERGTAGLWVLSILLLIAGSLGGVYYFQDRVVDYVPALHGLMTDMGVRKEHPGAGLELRHAGTPERLVQGDTEVLVVRGIIANISDRDRPVPTMKLVLLDGTKTLVQDKISQPPVTMLSPGGTSGFRIILERPNPAAVEVNIVFVDTAESGNR